MITLRLFKTADPFREIEARTLERGEISLGVDAAADWVIADGCGELSRRHCMLGADERGLWLCDTSTNGVFLGADKRRAVRGERHEIMPDETIYLGEHMILLDPNSAAEAGAQPIDLPVAGQPTLGAAVVSNQAGEIGCSKDRRFIAPTDAALLEAFCRGARLEPSSFAGEDPAALMNRLGVVYRQVIDDLSELMSDRATLRDSLQLERTTISARDNNPLKWAPAARVAVDLLREGDTGFLKGASAFRASFADLRRHGAGLLAGSRAAIRGVILELDPADIEAGVKRQPLGFTSRFETAWRQFQERHGALKSAADSSASGRIERAFREGYAAHLDAVAAKEEAA
jgi:predicted component of type VI protein secretion system